VLVLSGRPNIGENDTRGQLARLAEADGDQGRFLAATIRALFGTTSDHLDERAIAHGQQRRSSGKPYR